VSYILQNIGDVHENSTALVSRGTQVAAASVATSDVLTSDLMFSEKRLMF